MEGSLSYREADFIYNCGDKKQVENVLLRKGKTWHEQVCFNFFLYSPASEMTDSFKENAPPLCEGGV
jgi:hypothetical protein